VASTGLAAAALVVGPAGPASAAACSGSSGVTVVVSSSVACASGDPSSALSALRASGHSVTMVQRFPGAICRIDGRPERSCVTMPPADAYWSFWTASRGGSWRYASTGAAAYDPKPGTVVGFAFGAGAPPAVAPPAASAPRTSTTTTSTPRTSTTTRAATSKPRTSTTTRAASPRTTTRRPATAAPAGPGTTSRPTSPAPRPTASGGGTASVATSSAAASSTAPTSTPGTAAAASPDATSLDVVGTAARRPTDDGGALGPALLGAGVVAALGTAAGVVAWRRRGQA
jgi:hypothetical protein